MSREALAIGTDTRPPVLFHGDYEQWSLRFLNFLKRQDLASDLILSIKEGPAVITQDVPGNPTNNPPILPQREIKPPSQYTEAEKRRVNADHWAHSYLLLGIPNEIFTSVDSLQNAKDIWDELGRLMRGTDKGSKLRVLNVMTAYENFKAKEDESLEQTYHRFLTLLNDLRKCKIHKDPIDSNLKFLRNLLPEWRKYAEYVRQHMNIDELTVHQIYEELCQNEEHVLEKRTAKKSSEKSAEDSLALLSEKRERSSSGAPKEKATVIQLPSSEEDLSNIDSDPDVRDLHRQLALITKTFNRRFNRKPSNKLRTSSTSKAK